MKKNILITGSSRGIGRGIAERLLREGHTVIVNGTRAENEISDSIRTIKKLGDAHYCPADIADRRGRDALIAFVKNLGRLDVLVNNAGVAPDTRQDLLQMTEESYDRVMNINLKGPFLLTQKLAQWMAENVSDKNPVIINVGSISAYTSSVARGEYCLSKAGMGMMTMLFADRLAEFGIRVYEIRPGIIKTDMTGSVREKYEKMIAEGLTPIRRWGEPEDIAQCVLAIVNERFCFSTGEVFNIDGGFHLRRL